MSQSFSVLTLLVRDTQNTIPHIRGLPSHDKHLMSITLIVGLLKVTRTSQLPQHQPKDPSNSSQPPRVRRLYDHVKNQPISLALNAALVPRPRFTPSSPLVFALLFPVLVPFG
jgi:hypothetical protein